MQGPAALHTPTVGEARLVLGIHAHVRGQKDSCLCGGVAGGGGRHEAHLLAPARGLRRRRVCVCFCLSEVYICFCLSGVYICVCLCVCVCVCVCVSNACVVCVKSHVCETCETSRQFCVSIVCVCVCQVCVCCVCVKRVCVSMCVYVCVQSGWVSCAARRCHVGSTSQGWHAKRMQLDGRCPPASCPPARSPGRRLGRSSACRAAGC